MILTFLTESLQASWQLLIQAAPYMLFGLLVGGLLKVFLSAEYVARHLGRGKYRSVIKASLLGIPIPLCSCGVLPAASSLKKQGANRGATASFLISTPESGVDSISITYGLLDPIMTVARPFAAFLSAMAAGISINVLEREADGKAVPPPPPPSLVVCHGDSHCSEEGGGKEEKKGILARLGEGLRFAATDIWGDLAGWFFIGLLAAGVITVLLPDELISTYLGGGLGSMLLMLCLGIPLYICATASTPIAAAFILKGVSPGSALVFLLTGPATNVTSLSVLIGILGKWATAIYLGAIAVMAVLCGLLLDLVYFSLGISAVAIVGEHGDILPEWVSLGSVLLLLLLSIGPLVRTLQRRFAKNRENCGCNGQCKA